MPSAARRCLLQAGAALLGGAALAPSTAMTPAAPAAPAAPALPGVETGSLVRLADFASQHVAARHVDVWLPEGFAADGRHAVLYMHDGQMLYDARTTWNKQAWNVQTVAARLMAAGQVRPFIVVGVWNSGPTRFAEYFPQRFVDHLAPGPARDVLLQRAAMGPVRSDAYLRFLVEELKPAIDARFRPATGPGDTFIAGSSMGGLISLYALTEHPQVFGGAAACPRTGSDTSSATPRCLRRRWPTCASTCRRPGGTASTWTEERPSSTRSTTRPRSGWTR